LVFVMFELAQFAVALWGVGIDRARALRADDTGDRDLGATALEWAIISAILVTAAVLIGGIIYGVVQKKGSDLQKCSDTPVGGSC
jgi:hypothetical protein